MESLVYNRLASTLSTYVGTRLYPTTPTEDTELPFVYYTRSETNPQTHLKGCDITNYKFDVEVIAFNFDSGRTIADAIHGQLTGVWNGQKCCLMQSETSQQEDDHYHIVQSWSIWV